MLISPDVLEKLDLDELVQHLGGSVRVGKGKLMPGEERVTQEQDEGSLYYRDVYKTIFNMKKL